MKLLSTEKQVFDFPSYEKEARERLEALFERARREGGRLTGFLGLLTYQTPREARGTGLHHDGFWDDSVAMLGAVTVLAVRMGMRLETDFLRDLVSTPPGVRPPEA